MLLNYLPKERSDSLLSGLEDDAAAFTVTPDLAIVQTIDFITPIVNDPYSFGAIAAANALSDIYAIGATPLFALNVVSFPVKSMPMDVLGAILTGGVEKAKEAGIPIVGGHSIDDTSPKYGLTVTGSVNPAHLIHKRGCRTGDALVLTKPLGTGILSTGVDQGIAGAEIEELITAVMLRLNKDAATVMRTCHVHACTDVSGYGLLGHLSEMLEPDQMAVVNFDKIPVLHPVWEVLKHGGLSSGTQTNTRYLREMVKWDGTHSASEQYVLCDAQTSGGLLIAVPDEAAADLVHGLEQAGTLAQAVIGRIEERKGFAIEVKF